MKKIFSLHLTYAQDIWNFLCHCKERLWLSGCSWWLSPGRGEIALGCCWRRSRHACSRAPFNFMSGRLCSFFAITLICRSVDSQKALTFFWSVKLLLGTKLRSVSTRYMWDRLCTIYPAPSISKSSSSSKFLRIRLSPAVRETPGRVFFHFEKPLLWALFSRPVRYKRVRPAAAHGHIHSRWENVSTWPTHSLSFGQRLSSGQLL